MLKEVDALRASLDSRLAALEKALADPKQHGSLEALILDLARVATQEADATARSAVLDAQKAGEAAAAAARTEAVEALQAEKVESAALRQVIEQAKAALKQAEAALKDERRKAEAAGRELTEVQRELTAAREALQEHQTASASHRAELDAARAALEGERARASSADQQIAAMRAQMESERAALEAERATGSDLLQRSAALEQELDDLRGELEASRRDLEGTRRELANVRAHAEARTQTLSDSQTEQDQALASAREAARSVEARLQQEILARDAVEQDSAELKLQLQRAEDAVRERDLVLRQMQAAHEARDAAEVLEAARHDHPDTETDDDETDIDLTAIAQEEEERYLAVEKRIRSLELALRDAEMRAESAELELDRNRRAPVAPAGAVLPAPLPIAAPVTPAAPPEGEQYRGPARGARRVSFKPEPDVQIDGSTGKLVDLSLTGAQILTSSAINPNRLITVTLAAGENAVVCKAKVMWSRLEPRAGQLWYRAGVCFSSGDQLALEALMGEQQK